MISTWIIKHNIIYYLLIDSVESLIELIHANKYFYRIKVYKIHHNYLINFLKLSRKKQLYSGYRFGLNQDIRIHLIENFKF